MIRTKSSNSARRGWCNSTGLCRVLGQPAASPGEHACSPGSAAAPCAPFAVLASTSGLEYSHSNWVRCSDTEIAWPSTRSYSSSVPVCHMQHRFPDKRPVEELARHLSNLCPGSFHADRRLELAGSNQASHMR